VASLAVVRDLRTGLRLGSPEEMAAFEQDLLAEFVFARSSAGVADATIRQDVAAVCQLRDWFGRPLWELTPSGADRYFGAHLREAAPATRQHKANAIAIYFEFLEVRHKPEIHTATGFVVESPLDEINRPRGSIGTRIRIPPAPGEIRRLFGGWQRELGSARKYAPSARNYTACRLSSLIGPRVSELSLLRMGDLRWELGTFGKVVFHGKGSRGRGKKDRLVPLINGARELMDWWVTEPRWAFDDRVNDPLAPVFPSERRNGDASSSPVETDALRYGLAVAVRKHLPEHAGRLTPHMLRHFAASDLYRHGMDVVALQEVLGHRWLNTTMIYVHVDRTHIEDAWARAGRRAAERLGGR
jgi:integrase